jgi:hypothetical protein
VVRKIQRWKDERGMTVFLISHSVKTGDVAGPNELKHDVDANVFIDIKSDGARTIEMKKNRFGPSFEKFELKMNDDGVTLRRDGIDSYSDPNYPTGEELVAHIYNLLIDGNHVGSSKECYPDITWRGARELARQQLDEAGFKVFEYMNNGDLTYSLRNGWPF